MLLVILFVIGSFVLLALCEASVYDRPKPISNCSKSFGTKFSVVNLYFNISKTSRVRLSVTSVHGAYSLVMPDHLSVFELPMC
jgi:hypothetical protein